MEEKKEIKTKGRKLSGKELEEHIKAFTDIEDSIKLLKKEKK